MSSIAELAVRISADLKNFEKNIGGMPNMLQNASRKMADVGRTMTKNVTLPMLAIGTAAIAAANEMDKAYDAIRAGTGATGEALEALKKDFKEVFVTVPQGAEVVGQALADISTRTGRTGQGLQDLTFQMLNLARIANEDVSSLIASTTRVFGDWDIATEKQAGTLDYLFKVSQNTGVGVDSLAQRVVQFGAPLRQMGFDFETSAALLGKFEKEGVNTELVMGSLRIALGKMAREGIEDPSRALQVLIRRIQEAGSAGQANAIALEAFGARAGPDMAAAIREGRFDIESLFKLLEGSEETINSAAEDTLSFSKSMAILKNQATDALEPLGKVLLDLFESSRPFLEMVIDNLSKLSEWFGALDESTRNNYLIVLGSVLVAGPLLGFLANLAGVLFKIIGFFTTIGGTGAGSAAAAAGGLGKLGTAAGGLGSLGTLGTLGVAGAAAGGIYYGTTKAGLALREAGIESGKTYAWTGLGVEASTPSNWTTSTAKTAERMSGLLQYATGTDYVPHDGPAYLHRGEAVIPASQNRGGGGITININGPISSKQDADYYAKYMVKRLRLEGIG